MKNLTPALLTMIPALVAGLAKWTKLSWYIRLLVLQVAAAIIVNSIAAAINSSASQAQNHLLFNGFMILDFYLVFTSGYPYYGPYCRWPLYLAGCITFALVWLGSIVFQGVTIFASYALVYAFLVISVAYLYVLLRLFLDRDDFNHNALILLYLGGLIYCWCCIPLFSFLYFLNSGDRPLAYNIYGINQFLAATRYILLTIGFSKIK